MSDEGIPFGRWRLLPRIRMLVTGGERIVLGGRATDLLLALIEAGGGTIDRDTLVSRVWPGRTVEDGNLRVQISALRRAFGGEGAEIIATVPGRGYRFGGSLLPSPTGPPVTAASRTAHGSTGRPSLAVLPFRSLGEGTDQSHIADGIVENLITALSRIRWFDVLARNSAFSFKDRDLLHVALGRELGVRYVVTGMVHHVGGRIRVNADLVETTDGVAVWSDRVDRATDDVFALQDHIVGSIVGALEPGLRRAEIERLRQRPTQSPSAYAAYQRAVACMHPLTPDNSMAALALLDEALAIDPSFALALATAAQCRMWRVSQDFAVDVPSELAEAIRLLEAALALSTDDPYVLAQAGAIFAYLGYRRDIAATLADRAVDLHPNSAFTRTTAGWVYLFEDGPSTAIEHFEVALRLDPVDPGAGLWLAGISYAHLMAGHLEAAMRWGERAIAASPEMLSAHRAYVAALGSAGRPAAGAVAQLLALDPGFNVADFSRLRGRRPDARLNHLVNEGLRRAGIPERSSATPGVTLKVVR